MTKRKMAITKENMDITEDKDGDESLSLKRKAATFCVKK